MKNGGSYMAGHYFVESLTARIDGLADYQLFGRVTKILGLLIEVGGVERELSIGDRCTLVPKGAESVPCEVVGFREGRALVMPFKALDKVGLGCRVEVAQAQASVFPSDAWLGRVINAMGEPLD